MTAMPVVRGLPVVGSALEMARDPAAFFVTNFRRHGPVFRVRVLNRSHPVLAGPEAATFLGTAAGRDSLRSKEFWQGLVDEYGANRTILGEDGASHRELRDIMRRGYSRDAIKDRLAELVEITDRAIDRDWAAGARVPVVRALQNMVTDQLGQLLTGSARPEYVGDIRISTQYTLNVLVTRQWPRILLWDPRYRRAKRRVFELSETLAAHHRPGAGDLIDDVMQAHRDRPAVMPAADLPITLTGPFVAGLDTVASTTAAVVYEVLRDPDVLARVRADADALFADGTAITERDLRGLTALHGALLETMRLHPIAVTQMRTATRDFEFAGHRIAAGETVFVATSVPHFLDEFFPDPARFDIDRYEKPRAEHLQPGAYSPYGRGQHVCLGKTLADVQMTVLLARLLHRLDLRLDPPGYRLAKRTAPVPGPALSFRVRVTAHRH
ncbi:MAG TPA: cytochrome P450 [Actinoplanes sp.]|nr:cytochrome P450 [Actinoplanes sp.]